MAPASSLDHTIAQSVYGTHAVGTLLLVHLRVTRVITSVAFSPDGTRIVSGSEDYTIRGLTHAKHNNPIFHTPHPLSHLKHFVFQQDGWITVDNYPFFWISPLLRPYLPFPSNTFVIGPRGSISITYPPHLNVGTMWPSSFAPHTY